MPLPFLRETWSSVGSGGRVVCSVSLAELNHWEQTFKVLSSGQETWESTWLVVTPR